MKKFIPYGKFEAPGKCYNCAGSGLEICGRCAGRGCSDCGGVGTKKCCVCNGTGISD